MQRVEYDPRLLVGPTAGRGAHPSRLYMAAPKSGGPEFNLVNDQQDAAWSLAGEVDQ